MQKNLLYIGLNYFSGYAKLTLTFSVHDRGGRNVNNSYLFLKSTNILQSLDLVHRTGFIITDRYVIMKYSKQNSEKCIAVDH